MTVEDAVKRFVRSQTAPSSVVRKRYPKAGAFHWAGCWTIYTNEAPESVVLGTGKTALLAWKNAVRNLSSSTNT